jgi:predicted nucleotidyltransferase
MAEDGNVPNAKVRLSAADQQALIGAVLRTVDSAAFGTVLEISVFGSRARPEARGGDIDIWVAMKRASPLNHAETRVLARALRLAIQAAIGERKVDLLITPTDNAERERFAEIIRDQREILWRKPSPTTPNS